MDWIEREIMEKAKIHNRGFSAGYEAGKKRGKRR